MEQLWLIVGLGNPGPQYRNTRHNIGADILDICIQGQWREHLGGVYIRVDNILYLRPMTYMNNSGSVVSNYLNYYKIDPLHVLIIYDDVDIPLGSIRLRRSGSAGGHNGMRSIIEHMHSTEIIRIRIGIGPTSARLTLNQYVLSKFTPAEQSVLASVTARIAPLLPLIPELEYQRLAQILGGNE